MSFPPLHCRAPNSPGPYKQNPPCTGVKHHQSSTHVVLPWRFSPFVYRKSCTLSSRFGLARQQKTKKQYIYIFAKNARRSPWRSHLSSHCPNIASFSFPKHDELIVSALREGLKTKSDPRELPCSLPPPPSPPHLPGRWQPDMLRPGTIGIRGSIVLRTTAMRMIWLQLPPSPFQLPNQAMLIAW